jgi:hypothetical protein
MPEVPIGIGLEIVGEYTPLPVLVDAALFIQDSSQMGLLGPHRPVHASGNGDLGII